MVLIHLEGQNNKCLAIYFIEEAKIRHGWCFILKKKQEKGTCEDLFYWES